MARRRPTGTDAIDWLQGRRAGVGLQTIVMVEAWRTQGHETSDDRRYDISRLGPDPQQMGDSVHRHGTIENSLHWVRAIAFREDDSRIRKGNAPQNFAMRRPIAGHLLKQERTKHHGVKAKRNRAGWDHAYLLTVLGI